jgi:hypothetical protein
MTVSFTEKEGLVPGLGYSWYKIGGDRPWGRRSGLSCTRFGLFLVQDKEVCDA